MSRPASRPLLNALSRFAPKSQPNLPSRQWQNNFVCRGCQKQQIRRNMNAADSPDFKSILDNPPQLMRSGKRHGPGIIILALIPITAFALGTWQVQRLDWKTKMIATYEDRLIKDPLPLPPHIDPSVVPEFDYRRVTATGHYRHDQEMLMGPRIHEGINGYTVVTPLEREGDGTTILVSRGWISKDKMRQADRPEGLPKGEVIVEGLLRSGWKKNRFTPENDPERGNFYFPDIEQMAKHTGSQPIWVEETMEPDLIVSMDREAKGIPIGRPAEVNIRNNHLQYIFTWYALTGATLIMLGMVLKKPSSSIKRKVRHSKQW